ncbi:MAG: DUF2268 domain-containing putative Zn-dependent protease [Bacteroidota bacterium]
MRFTLACLFFTFLVNPVQSQEVLTQDILHFWEAYDSLATTTDSVGTIQRLYIDRKTDGFKAFLKARKFTAKEYVRLIRMLPDFWPSVRPNTLKIKQFEEAVQQVYTVYDSLFPGFEPPKVCFAIGCLRTGGTVHNGYLLIGTEIVAADSTTDMHELNPWLQSVMGHAQVKTMVAHETTHYIQSVNLPTVWGYFGHRVLMMSLREGAADFVARLAIGHSTKPNLYAWGDTHEAEVWADFQKEMRTNKLNNWMYNGNKSKDRPADLGYYMGYQIVEAYFDKHGRTLEALDDIIKMGRSKKFLRESGYQGP